LRVLKSSHHFTRLSGLRRHQSRRAQVLASSEQRTGKRHKLQNSSTTLLKEKKRKCKRKHHKTKSRGLCQMA
jgi:hypothetical protein